MKKKEREQLDIVRGLLTQAADALLINPVQRGQALGALLDAREIIEALTAIKGEVDHGRLG